MTPEISSNIQANASKILMNLEELAWEIQEGETDDHR